MAILDRGYFLTIDTVKEELNNYLGKDILITYNLGRNKFEKYSVTIKELYDHIFLVESKEQNQSIKSFSYSDVLTKTIRINYL